MTDTMPEKIDLATTPLSEDKLAQLRQLFPEAFTEGKIGFDALKRSLGDAVDTEPANERFGLRWPGKSKLQQVINQPSVGTLVPQPEQSVDWDTTQNMIIEGDNLEVLKLLQKSYAGKVKMIYIDPPYNTGNDFVYPDNYKEGLQSYLEFTGQVDGNGRKLQSNTESTGRYHANWLNMMYPRLYLARNLLRGDGFIFISIDHNELHNLLLLCNEIYGSENFRNLVVVRRGTKNVQAQFETISNLSNGHEYLLLYSAQADTPLPKLSHHTDGMQSGKWDTFWRGTDRATMRYELFGHTPVSGQWRWAEDRARQAAKNYAEFIYVHETDDDLDDYYLSHLQGTNRKLNFVRLNDEGVVQYHVPPRDYRLISDNWMDISIKGNEIGFETEKHTHLLNRMVNWITDSGDLILDFFAGSGTTGHAVMQQNAEDGGNRRYIMVQLPEPLDEPKTLDDEATLHTIADICRERVRRAGRKIESEMRDKAAPAGESSTSLGTTVDTGFRVYKLAPSNFRPWDGRAPGGDSARQASYMPQTIQQQLDLAADHLRPDATDSALLAELLLKIGFELTTDVLVEEMAGKQVYNVENGTVLVCLDRHITLDEIEQMAARIPAEIICLDAGFPDDQTKVNAGQIIASHARDEETSIQFKVV